MDKLEYMKNYTCMKNLIDNSVMTCDEIIDMSETVWIYWLKIYKMD